MNKNGGQGFEGIHKRRSRAFSKAGAGFRSLALPFSILSSGLFRGRRSIPCRRRIKARSFKSLASLLRRKRPFFLGSDLRELALGSVELLIGETLYFSDRTYLDIAITEDVVVKTSPDVVFHFALIHQF